MKGMIDGRRLKYGYDNNQLGELVLGHAPYDYEADSVPFGYADEQAKLTRLRQVTDFLRCQSARQHQRVVPTMIARLEESHEGWAKAGALFLKRFFPL